MDRLLGPATVSAIAALGKDLTFVDDIAPAFLAAGILVEEGHAVHIIRTNTAFGIMPFGPEEHLREALDKLDLGDVATVYGVLTATCRLASLYSAGADGRRLARLAYALGDDAAKIERALVLGGQELGPATVGLYPGTARLEVEKDVSRVNIDRQAIARMMREIQTEFDKHKIVVPVEASSPVTPSGVTHVYNGPVFHGDANGAQLAWNNESVTQNYDHAEQVTPGYEPLALAITKILEGLTRVDVGEDEREFASEAAHEVLTEVTQAEPDRRKITRGVLTLKGVLTTIALAGVDGVGDQVREWAQAALEALQGVVF